MPAPGRGRAASLFPRSAAVLAAAALLAGAAGASPARAAEPAPGSLMERVIPGDGCGSVGRPHPTSAYTIDFDEGGFTQVGRKALGWMTELAFGLDRWLVSTGIWIVEWSFSFGFADRLASPVAALAGRLERSLFAPLVGSALTIAAGYGAAHVFRGRLGRGVGEFGFSMLVVGAFGAWMLSNPQGVLEASLDTTAGLAGSVAALALDRPEAGCTGGGGRFSLDRYAEIVAPLTRTIHHSFVEEPYELVQWGAPVEPGCRDERDAVLARGAGGDRDRVVRAMDVPGCEELHRFNRDPSMERLGVALLALLAAGVVVGALAAVAVTVVLAQLVAVGLVALMPLAALAGAVPGPGRQAMWAWAGALARAMVTILAMALLLTFLLVTTDALLAATEGESMMVRVGILNLAALLAFTARRRVLHAGHRIAASWGRRLEGAVVAGAPGGSWHAPAAVAGLSGFGNPAARGEAPAPARRIASAVAGAVRNVRSGTGATPAPAGGPVTVWPGPGVGITVQPLPSRRPGSPAPASGAAPKATASTVAPAPARTEKGGSTEQGEQLGEHLRLLKKYGADGHRELPDGRLRYYGPIRPPRTMGPMIGTRKVREWDPASGRTRTWFETLDACRRVRVVRPEQGKARLHCQFDHEGNHAGTW